MVTIGMSCEEQGKKTGYKSQRGGCGFIIIYMGGGGGGVDIMRKV
jgi:hypothetical protein